MDKKEKIDEFDYQILCLTGEFYHRYPNPPYIELLKKEKRSYNCLLIQSHYGYFICIPYRSEIKHKNAFLFKNTKRSKYHKSGLDYSKMVIVSDLEYIDDKTTKIDQDEYKATRDNIVKIKDAAVKYIDEYVAFLKDGTGISRQEFKRKYEYSTLKYFHNELGLESE